METAWIIRSGLFVAGCLWVAVAAMRKARRRRREELGVDERAAVETAAPDHPQDARAAGVRFLQRLSPQERAALLLKEMFEMSIDEIAELLATTPGAVKAALHRGRERLAEADGGAASRRPLASPELVDAFVERWIARDFAGLASLFLDGASIENVGEALQFGRDTALRTHLNILWHVVNGHEEWPAAYRPESIRMERAELDGEPLVLVSCVQRGREALQVVYRLEESEGQIARLRIYVFCPETMRAVGERLGRPVRTGLYHAPEDPLRGRR